MSQINSSKGKTLFLKKSVDALLNSWYIYIRRWNNKTCWSKRQKKLLITYWQNKSINVMIIKSLPREAKEIALWKLNNKRQQ